MGVGAFFLGKLGNLRFEVICVRAKALLFVVCGERLAAWRWALRGEGEAGGEVNLALTAEPCLLVNLRNVTG